MQIHPNDVLLGLLPFFHIYGLTTLILTPLVKCVPIVLMPKFDLVQMLELIQNYKITFANLVPPIILALTKHPVVAKYDLSSMRGIMSGAAPLGKELQQAAEKRLKVTIAQVGQFVTWFFPMCPFCCFALCPLRFLCQSSCKSMLEARRQQRSSGRQW
jgi:acyl-CoA synthetase (AMP-forming)/AMP-acid ligase II